MLTTLVGAEGNGGDLFGVNHSIGELTKRMTEVGGSALAAELTKAQKGGESESRLKELLELEKEAKETLAEELALSQGQYKAFSEMVSAGELPPWGGSFDAGGVVPGPRGQAKTAILHGGEGVLSLKQMEGKEGAHVQLIVHPNAGVDVSKLEVIADGVQQRGNRRTVRMSLLSRTGAGGDGSPAPTEWPTGS
jgi:hypothetical protein